MTHAIHRTIALWVGILAMILLPVSYWYISSVVVYCFIVLSVSLVYHRYFAHSCTILPKWKITAGSIFGSITLNSSPFQWYIIHCNHHKYSDTVQDPHPRGLANLFQFKNRVLRPPSNSVRIIKDPLQKFLAKYSFYVSFIFALLCYLIGGLVMLAHLYFIPIAVYMLVSAMHNTYSHGKNGPRNLPAMEFILPLFGEWYHQTHHEKPKQFKFGSYDFIGCIFGESQ